ncbi:MAG: 50S ribosomal protein L32 [Parcubacteria group bacterium]|nr:50S ribosomal protein L32 [Parcubacteria group bacterium]MCR4342384.1 50S ribosomal protein L32 [Patescibacteria group bacterium]
MPHRVCKNCGSYKGKEVIDVLARLTKKEKKHKEKELQSQEGKTKEGKTLSARELSQK